jgi:hypothetical protein
MKLLPIVAALALALSFGAGTVVRADSPNALLDRMAAINPHLRTFTATLHASVAMRSFPFLSADLVGTYYFKQPDRTKLVLTSGVPLVDAQFDKLYAHIEPPSRWRSLYQVTIVSDDGTTAVFRLVPRKGGNVTQIDATADDRSATVTSMRWSYENGGYAEMTNRYGNVDGNLVVESQTGHVQEPGYVADIKSTLGEYKLNPDLSDAIFAGE